MRKKTKKSFDKLTFDKRLKVLREQTGLNQEETGTAIESGRSAPSADCIMDIVKAFESHKVYTTLDYLFGRTNHANDSYQLKELREKLDQEQLLEKPSRK